MGVGPVALVERPSAGMCVATHRQRSGRSALMVRFVDPSEEHTPDGQPHRGKPETDLGAGERTQVAISVHVNFTGGEVRRLPENCVAA